MYLSYRKNCVQSPTRKQGWDLFRRTSDDILVRRYNLINIHEDGSEAPRVSDIVVEERASE